MAEQSSPPSPATDAPRPLAARLLWFVGLWVGGVAAVAITGLIIKLALKG
jgi:hypothetical protein